MKIILLNPPLTLDAVYGKYKDLASFQPPIGLCSLGAVLLKNGYKNTRILDANVLGFSILECIAQVKRYQPDVIGIYCNTANYHVVVALSHLIKKWPSPPQIAVGGPHPTFMAKEVLELADVDFCVMGEGEKTFHELILHIEDRLDDYSAINGLAYKKKGGEICVNPPRERINDLDSLPFPSIDLLPSLNKYRMYMLHHKKTPYMTVLTSRGCPFGCIFCNTPFGKSVKYHSPEYVIEYITYLKRIYGIKEVHFCDDTFCLNEERVANICELIQSKDLRVSWYAATRVGMNDNSLLKKMKHAGCWICAIGVESGDPAILKNIGKQISLKEVEQTARAVRKAKMMLKAFFIIGHPGETIESIDRTIQFSLLLKAHYPVFSLMTPYPGTSLWKNAHLYGSFDHSDFKKLLISGPDPVFVPFGLTKEILLKKQKEAFLRAYLSPKMIARQLFAIDSFSDIEKLGRAAVSFLKIQTAPISLS